MQNRSATPSSQIVLAVSLIALSLTFALPTNAYLKGDVNGDDKISLSEAINALQVVSEARSALSTKTINVPADIPTIQQAIDAASEGDTINIAAGTYNEHLEIDKDNIKLQGAGRGITVINGNGTDRTIELSNARNIEVKNCSFRKGSYGIALSYSSLECTNVAIDNNSSGLRIRYNSYIYCQNTYITNNSGVGVEVSYGSTGLFGYCEINNNNRNGIISQHSASVAVWNSKISNNGGTGIQAWMGGCMTSEVNEIKSNGGPGIDITGNSSGALYGNNSITNNNTGGITIYHNSYCITNATDDISQNQGPGIMASNNSAADIKGTTINNNIGDGVLVQGESTSSFEGAIIHSNGGYGVNCQGGKLYQNQPIDFGSESAGTLNTLGDINGCY